MTRVGVHAEDAGQLRLDAGFLFGLADRALARGLAELLLPHRYRPLAGVAAPLHQDPAVVVDDEDAAGGDQAVRRRGGGVVQVLGAAHQTSSPDHGFAVSHTRRKQAM